MPVQYLSRFAVGGGARPDALTGLNPQFTQSIASLLQNAPPEVQNQVRISSAYRSPQRQSEILSGVLTKRVGPEAAAQWGSYVQQANGDVIAAGEAARPWLRGLGITKWVAPPGSSNHQKGVAVDLQYLNPAATQWMHQNAPKHGLNFPLSNEDWHLEPANARAMAGTPTVAPQMTATTPGSAPAAPGPSPLVNAVAGAPMARPDDLGAILALADADPVKKQQTKMALRQQQNAAEKARRAALFGGDGVASLYG